MKTSLVLILSFLAALAAVAFSQGSSGKPSGQIGESGKTDVKTKESKAMAKAMFGAGCFWGVEATFRQVEGVTATEVGYAGGTVENPTYEQVCSDTTGHAEVVQVEYDPSRVTYEKLLEVFWENHDPTQVNRQGPDIGAQYRSVIFYYDAAQQKAAEASKQQLEQSGAYGRPIATSIEPAPTFWRAEEYHQRYLEKRGLSTCRIK